MQLSQATTLVLLAGMLCTGSSSCSPSSATADEKTTEVGDGLDASASKFSSADGSVTVSKKWAMPPELLEISGISWMDDQRMACVQDEAGSLFIYNLRTSRVEREIPFAGPGDYEAVSKAGDRFYVMRADGYIFELDPTAKNPVVQKMDIGWSGKHDIEAMSYDAAGKRLLLTDKMDDKGSMRRIYAFDLTSRQMSSSPVLELDLGGAADDEKDSGKKGGKKKGGGHAMQPSAMATHPQTGDIYLTDGGESTLWVLDRTGKVKRFIKLNKDDFPQPEGLTISPKGEVYISSEGVKGDGVIARISM